MSLSSMPSNHSEMPWIVQKFGGTSIGKFATCITEEIIPKYLEHARVAIVCSARSASSKDQGTTSLLLAAAAEALETHPTRCSILREASSQSGNSEVPSGALSFTSPSSAESLKPFSVSSALLASGPATPSTPLSSWEEQTWESFAPSYTNTVNIIKSEHLLAARELIQDFARLRELEIEIEKECNSLERYLSAIQIIGEMSPRLKDIITAFGERLACRLVTAALQEKGIDAGIVVLDSILEDDFTYDVEDDKLDQKFYDQVGRTLSEKVKGVGARVPVVTGFFGPVPGSLLTRVGRGYSDFTAALVAVGLNASELQIWKEVDGVLTADPRTVPNARLLPSMSPDEAAELTYFGSEVIHPLTMEQAIRNNIPIRIKNVKCPSGHGTIIYPGTNTSTASSSPNSTNSLRLPFSQASLPTAIVIKEKISILRIHSIKTSTTAFMADVFDTLATFKITAHLIDLGQSSIKIAVEDSTEGGLWAKMIEELKSQYETVTARSGMSILSLVGEHMSKITEMTGQLCATLAEGGVEIEMIGRGASDTRLSCVIDQQDSVKALNLVHSAFWVTEK